MRSHLGGLGCWGAIAAVLSTSVLIVFTYRLGRAANRASHTAVEIAHAESRRQAFRDAKERVLVLMQITGEVSTKREHILDIVRHLGEDGSEAYFLVNQHYREDVFGHIARINFPLTVALTDRVHYLESKVGGSLVRAVGLFRTIQENYLEEREGVTQEEWGEVFRLLGLTLPAVAADLALVQNACKLAVAELGLENYDLAKAAVREPG